MLCRLRVPGCAAAPLLTDPHFWCTHACSDNSLILAARYGVRFEDVVPIPWEAAITPEWRKTDLPVLLEQLRAGTIE